jgi:hypothetical protein
MPKRDSIASNSYKNGSISVKYRFFLLFLVFPQFFRFSGFSPKVTSSISVFKKHRFFPGLPKNRLTLRETNRLESLEIARRRFQKFNSKYIESIKIARRRFQKFNSKYIESIKIARRRYPSRDTNFPHWGDHSSIPGDFLLSGKLAGLGFFEALL